MAAKEHFIKWVEGRAQQLRTKCCLTPFGRLDPFDLAKRMDVPVFTPQDIPGLDPDVANHVLTTGARSGTRPPSRFPAGRTSSS